MVTYPKTSTGLVPEPQLMQKIKELVDLVGLSLLVELQKDNTIQKIMQPNLYLFNNQYLVMLVEEIMDVTVVQYKELITISKKLEVSKLGMLILILLVKVQEVTVKLMIINSQQVQILILKLKEEDKLNGILCNKLYMIKDLQLLLLLQLTLSNTMQEVFMKKNVLSLPLLIMLYQLQVMELMDKLIIGKQKILGEFPGENTVISESQETKKYVTLVTILSILLLFDFDIIKKQYQKYLFLTFQKHNFQFLKILFNFYIIYYINIIIIYFIFQIIIFKNPIFRAIIIQNLCVILQLQLYLLFQLFQHYLQLFIIHQKIILYLLQYVLLQFLFTYLHVYIFCIQVNYQYVFYLQQMVRFLLNLIM